MSSVKVSLVVRFVVLLRGCGGCMFSKVALIVASICSHLNSSCVDVAISSSDCVSFVSYDVMFSGGHRAGGLCFGVFVPVAACALERTAMLLSLRALWSDPRSIMFVASQSFSVFQKRWLAKK